MAFGSSTWNIKRLFRGSYNQVIPGIIGLNTIVFLGWKYAEYRLDYKGDSRLKKWIMDHFYASTYSVFNKWHIWTLATSSFFHTQLLSLGVNMFVLYSFGPSLLYILGPKRFLGFYLGSSALSSLSCLLYQKWRREPGGYFGAGGPLSALSMYYALLYPHATFTLYFLFPVPALYAAVGFVGFNILSSLSSPGSGGRAIGHVGGALSGWLFWNLRKYRINRWF